ncbi:snRNA-activating protein complex subunit 3 [Drosophila madeirensis]|uniref:snRNA-activating protein complex subunit 3 n=1 Tax=Drosophila madeirensis TaxID=30013 RepID=A0AAU9G830_DROMD
MEMYLETLERPIHLRSFLSDYQEKLPKATGGTEEVPFFFSAASPVSEDVEKSCSLDLISSPDENCINIFQPGDDITRLNIVKPGTDRDGPKVYTALSAHKENTRKNAFGRTQFSYRLIPPPPGNKSVPMARPLDSPSELQITVRFYRPARATHKGLKLESPVFAEEFVCLGSNYLTELRDKIFCICNGRRFVDISNDPDAPLPQLETNPGYFFIYDTFYNDKRNPENCDYSETVIQWAAKAHGLQGEQFKVEKMESTRLIDLTVRPGAPLHYLHHGNCEHLFVFSQIEVLPANVSRLLDPSLYPLVRALNIFNRRSCYLCGLRGYEFIVEQSLRQLHDPSYLCRRCFLSFHYVNGEKVGQFKAYRIYDRPESLDEDGKATEGVEDAIDLESS